MATVAGSKGEVVQQEEEEMEEDKSTWKLVIIDPEVDTTSTCKLCFRTAQGEEGVRLGPLYKYGYCLAHHYCLMFSSGLNQEGEDEEGVKGFLPDSIVKEWRRGSMLKCCYCKKKYATVGCAHSNCKKGYHLPCGLENDSLQQFYGNFASFCSSHRPVQAPLVKSGAATLTLKEAECGVCLDTLEEVVGNNVLWAPCCGGWAHRPCVERMASAAGSHHFKCPLCNNRDEFTEEMKEFGIYVPDQDAEWEAGDAFGDQLQRHDRCDALDCLCPNTMEDSEGREGRRYDEEDTEWEIMLCVCCGHQGMHVKCGSLSLARPRWKCDFCKQAVKDLPSRPVPVFTRVKRGQEPPDQAYTRRVLSNLTFRVTNQEVEAGVVGEGGEGEVARFRVTAASTKAPPLPVKVRKEVKQKAGDLVRNIPCSYEDCTMLLNRLEYSAHLANHKGLSLDEEEEEGDESTIVEGVVREGEVVGVKEPNGDIYDAKVLKIEGARCKVHYVGWATTWDEWLDVPKEEDLKPRTKENKKKSKTKDNSKPVEDKKVEQESVANVEDKEVSKPKPDEKPEEKAEASQKRKPSTSSESSEPQQKKMKVCESSSSSVILEEKKTKTPPSLASSSKKTKKNEPKTEEKQSSILSFFSRFKPDAGGSPELKKKKNIGEMEKEDMRRKLEERLQDSGDEIEILEKVTPKKEEKEEGAKVVNSSLGFFKLADSSSKGKKKEEEVKEKEKVEEAKEKVNVVEKAPSTKFTCQHCKMTFSNMITWKAHENGHVQTSPSCTLCDLKFTSETSLRKHKDKEHGLEEVEGEQVEIFYYCDMCDKKVKSEKGLVLHKKLKHKKKEDEKVDEEVEEKGEEIVVEISTDDSSGDEVVPKDGKNEVIEISEGDESSASSRSSQPSVKQLASLMEDWD